MHNSTISIGQSHPLYINTFDISV